MTRAEAANMIKNDIYLHRDYLSGEYRKALKMAVSALEQPERKTGKWEQVEVNYLDDMDADIKESMAIASMYCPICKRYHNEVYLYGDPAYGVNYCPNCGAKMNGGDSDV